MIGSVNSNKKKSRQVDAAKCQRHQKTHAAHRFFSPRSAPSAGIMSKLVIFSIVIFFSFAAESENSLPCKYTILRGDRYGAKIHDMLYAWSYCRLHNCHYTGTLGQDSQTETLLRYLNVSWRGWKQKPSDCQELPLSEYRKEDFIKAAEPYFDELRRNVKHFRFQHETIVVHARRDDVSAADALRGTRAGRFLEVLKNLNNPPQKSVIIHSTNRGFDQEFRTAAQVHGWILKLDAPLESAWKDMIHADILVMSKSSFSFVPAFFNRHTVIYQPFWHNPLSHWTIVARPKHFLTETSSCHGRKQNISYLCWVNPDQKSMQNITGCWQIYALSEAQYNGPVLKLQNSLPDLPLC
eukprot:g75397.t1